MTIRSLHGLWIWRAVGIAAVAALACLYLRIVSLRRMPEWTDVGLTIAVFTLPTMQFQAMWVSMLMFWAPPMALGLVASRLLLEATERKAKKTALSAPVLGAWAALLCGLCFYPMSATIVLVPAAHLLVRAGGARFRWFAIVTSATLGAAFIAYFAIHKFLVLPNLRTAVPYLGEYQFVLHPDIVGEASRRVVAYLDLASYLWMPLEIDWIPWFALAAAIAGAIVALIRLQRRTLRSAAIIDFAFACALFLVATAPVLVVEQFSETNRITFTMTAVVMLAMFWLLRQILIDPLRPAAAFATLGGCLAFLGVYGTSRSNALEYEISRAAVAGLAPHDFHSIVLIRRPVPRVAFGLYLRNDFGGVSPAPYIFDALIGTRYNGAARFDVQTIKFDSEDREATSFLEKQSVLVDLSSISGVADVGDFSQFATVSAQPRGMIGPLNAVDGDPTSFWEVCGVPLPAKLEVDYPAARTISAYDLSTIEAPQRMPKDWEVWVSADRQSWHLVQDVIDAPAWQNHESRSFALSTPEQARAIRLVIEATRSANCMRLYEFTPK